MVYLIAGLVIFLGVHSVRIFADGWRTATLVRVGEGAYKGIYSLLSLAGFGLIIYGFGVARETPVVLWTPPIGLRHAASLLTLIAFIFLTAAYVPRNGIKARFHHPMVLGVKFWALAHLLANGQLAQVLLFGSFLAWAVLDFIASRRRDRIAGTHYAVGSLPATALTVAAGGLAWMAFALYLHGWLIGVRPFG
ncbi:MAG TPA: NnrU family protein [Rhodoferax sp.]|nr:NnrU family protein [Rhodoferax sp.]HPW29733.1 NnrU family protein [Rhodoferax sp.]